MAMLRLGTGRFELLRQVGEGGAGVVYEGRDLTTRAAVAVKLLHTGSELAQARFETEIAVLAELPHPAIVRYIAHGVAEDGRQYLVMEWLAGKTAAAHREGQWPVSEVLTLARRLVSGLAFAALRDISHRDIKPANLFLVDDDVANAKILDFGLARRGTDGEDLPSHGTVVGTPQFMSPEQALGGTVLDSRTDVFSLGSVLYACLCGRSPFLAPHAMMILEQICYEEPMPIEERAPQVPLRLRSLVQAMMQKRREERPAWQAIAEELSEIAEQHVELGDEALRPKLPSTRPSRTPSGTHRVRVEYRIVVAVFAAYRSQSGTPISTAQIAELRALVAQHGMRAVVLADDTRMLLPELSLETSEQAVVAARCALSLQQRLSGHGAFVVCTGRAALGDAEPFAELIGRASVLLADASTAQVHVDAASAALLETRFELGGLELEGMRRTLVCERSGGEAARTLLGEASPFVGREHELLQLQRVFEACVRERTARAVLVSAPAGGGKSRLLQALLSRLAASPGRFTRLSSRGDPMRGGTQFGVLASALLAWAEISAADGLAQQRAQLSRRVARIIAGERAPLVAAFLGELIGVPYPSEASLQLKAARSDHLLMADRMLESWLLFVDGLLDQGPTLLCVEDLHWSDPASVRFIDAALRSARERPLLVLGLGRPELHDRFPALWAERELIEVQLPKLDPAAAAQLLQRLAGAPIEPALQRAVLERADGNPFFLEELVRGLATRPRDRGLPETVLAVVQARLAQLSEQPKQLIQAASIFGRSFRVDGVCALLGDDLDVGAALAQLLEREVIVPNDVSGDQEFAFTQSLVRDAAYLLQSEQDRADGHSLAAAWLAHIGEAPALIADHCERGGDRTGAALHWSSAARRAFEVSSLDEALRFGARAVACGLPESAFGKLAVLLAEARSYVYDDIEAISWAERARKIFPPGTPEWWRVSQVAAIGYSRGGAPELDEVAEEMVAHFSSNDEQPEQALALSYTISDCLRTMRDDVAERLLALLPKQLPQSLAGRPEGCLAAARARKAFREGNLSAALRFGQKAVEPLRRAGALRDVSELLNLCGYLLHELGAYEQAEPRLLEATQLAQRMGSANDVSYGQLNLGSCYVRQGRYDEAERALGVAWEGYQKLAIVSFQGEVLGQLAEAQRARGELGRARQSAERALALDSLDPAPTALALARLSAIALTEGNPAEALEHAARARALADEQGVTEFVGVIAKSHVESLQAAGLHAEAREALRVAVRWIDEQAAKNDDPTWQRAFAEQIPEHAQLRRWATAPELQGLD